MNRFHLSFVLFFSYLPSLSFAEIEFIYAFKEQAHVQSGNDLSTTSVAWSFGAGVSGDGQVTGATLIYAPKSPRPVDLAGEDGVFETEYEPFSSQTALDLEFPSGNVSLSFTNDEVATDLGPFPIEGDSYPATPHILNAVGLQDSDFSREHLLRWNPFTDSAEGDKILFKLRDSSIVDLTKPIAGQGLVFEEVDGMVAVEAEHFYRQTATEHRAWQLTSSEHVPKFDLDGDPLHLADPSYGAYLEILPDSRRTQNDALIDGINFSNVPGALGIVSYKVYFNNPGRYYVWVRTYATGTEDNGIHVGLDGSWPESGQRMQWCDGKNTWHWESKQRTEQVSCGVPYEIYLDIEEAGEHEIMFSMREDGFEFDKFILTNDRDFVRPSDAGPAPKIKRGILPKAFPVVMEGEDSSSVDELIFELLDRTATSYLIPEGFLSANKTYELDVSFVTQTASLPESINAAIGYATTTRFPISTLPQINSQGPELGHVFAAIHTVGGVFLKLKAQEDALKFQLGLETSGDLATWSDGHSISYNQETKQWEMEGLLDLDISISGQREGVDGFWFITLAVVSSEPLFLRFNTYAEDVL
jgi:hypothetical protein